MYKKMTRVISVLTITLLLICSTKLVYAQSNPQSKGGKGEHKGWTKGKRIGQKSETPPGWKKGLKKGWKKSTPPGWDNWNKKTRKGWKKNLSKAKKEINAKAKRKGWGAKDREKAVIALEFAARRGVPVGHAGEVVAKCIVHGLTGEDTLRVGVTLSDGVSKGVNFKTLGSQVVEKLKAGYKGEKLANEIHTIIETRHKAKIKAQENKVGKPVKPKPEKRKRKSEKSEKKIRKSEGRGLSGGPGGKGQQGRGR